MKLYVWDDTGYGRIVIAMAHNIDEARERVMENAKRHWSHTSRGAETHDYIIKSNPTYVYESPAAVVIWADISSTEQ